MERVGRILGWLLVAATAVAIAAGAGLWLALGASQAERRGALTLDGLRRPVEIRFDRRARPYVRAESLEDAFFAQGFLHARERLWQMELLSRVGRGRLAELLGPSLLDTDRELWRTGVPQLARRLESDARPETRRRIDHYVAGVNAALDALEARPPELLLVGASLRRWTSMDVFALGSAMAFSSARNADNELLRFAIASTVSPDRFAAFLPDESVVPDFPYLVSARDLERILARRDTIRAIDQPGLASLSLGSNGWAVSPRRSRSGRALFAFDSHDGLSLPNLHYEVHLFFGDRRIRGWSVPGMPGVINGFNGHMAWGFTNIGDSQDLFLETRDPDDPLRFLGPDGWYSASTEEVEIPVKGREPERLRIVRTRHGPLLEEDPPIALSWTGHHLEGFGLDALFDLNLATDWTSTSRALDRLAAPSANANYADVSGRIAFRTVGRLPIRGRGSGLVPLPGHDRGVGWRGFVPMDRLPRSVDPPDGFVAAANARVSPPGAGPLVSADNAPGYRIGRIREVLAARDDHTPKTMQALQMDWSNGQAVRLLPVLLAALEGASLEPAAERSRSLLRDWRRDPVNDPGAAAPVIFLRWYLELAHDLFADALGPELWPRLLKNSYVLNHAVDGLLLAPTDASPWWGGDREGAIRRAFRRAVASLESEPGSPDPDGWRWDDHHRVYFSHELASAVPLLGRWLDRGPFPWGGDHASVGRARYRYDRPERVTSGATVRVVIEMNRPMSVRAILPGGQAGHPSDPHYDDQIAAWLAGDLEDLEADFASVSGSSLRLEPAVAPEVPDLEDHDHDEADAHDAEGIPVLGPGNAPDVDPQQAGQEAQR